MITKNKKKKGFTLVELIIVITILAILATIAFVSFQGYTKTSRDGNRVTTLGNIKKGLELFSIQTGNFPNPDGTITAGTINGQTLVKVGEIQDTISKLIKINTTPQDPLSKNFYTYGTTHDGKYYQIASIKEDLNSYIPGVQTSYAANTAKAKVTGNYNGLLKFNSGSETRVSNIPSLILNNTTTTNLLSGSTYYVIDNKENLPYGLQGTKDSSIQVINGSQMIQEITKAPTAVLTAINITNLNSTNIATIFTGATLVSFNTSGIDTSNTTQILSSLQTTLTNNTSSSSSNQTTTTEVIGSSSTNPGISCLDILNKGGSTGDGIYWIKPDSNAAFQIYCDMTTDGGGWTLVVGISGANRNHINTTAVTSNNLSSINGFGKLSDSQIRSLYSTGYKLSIGGGITYYKTTIFDSTKPTDTYGTTNLKYSCTYTGTYTGVPGYNQQLGLTSFGGGTCGAGYVIYGAISPNNGGHYPNVWSLNGTLWVK